MTGLPREGGGSAARAAFLSNLINLIKSAFIIIAVCVLLDITVFSASRYVTIWGDGPVEMSGANVNLKNAEREEETGLLKLSRRAEIEFPELGRRVVNVYIDTVSAGGSHKFQIAYGDETHSSRRTAVFHVIGGVEDTKYVTLQTSGNVSFLRLIYGGDAPELIRGVTLNKPEPLTIFWPRVFLFSLTAFAALVIKRKKLFSLPLRHDSTGQNLLTAGIMAAFAAYLLALSLLSEPFSAQIPFLDNFAGPTDQYNKGIVDAFLDGRTHLDIEPSEEFLALENPYDLYERNRTKAESPWDHVFYNGKFYSYFGVVQVLVLSLPYKLITGKYLPTRVAVLLFSTLAGVFLMLLWRRLVFRFMKNMPLGMYALGLLAAAMCSMITFPVVRAQFYEAAGSSAMFFAALGLWLILGSAGGIKRFDLAAGCTCMALAVGCRPNYLFVSLLVPVILFEDIKNFWRVKNDRKNFIGLFACAAVPYVLAACGLMWYNKIRFGSVFEFGANYQLTVQYVKAAHLLNPIGKLLKTLAGCFCYLIPSFDVRASFPFVQLRVVDIGIAYKGYIYTMPVLGVLALPLTWPLFGLGAVKKIIGERRQIFRLIAAMLCVGFIQMAFVASPFGGIHTRYELDFFWLFVFSGLICAYFMYEAAAEYQSAAEQLQQRTPVNLRIAAQKIICAGIVLSVILVFLLTLSSGEWNMIWNSNPDLYYFIQKLLGFRAV